jgi:hypothetical protein
MSCNDSLQDWARSAHGIAAMLVFVLAAVLIFANLGDQALWQDEAQTALVAQTIFQYGVPHGFDGRNYFSQESGAEYGTDYIWKWHTWLQFYILVPFLGLLGPTTLAARLPFALFGFASVVLAYFMAASMWRSWRAGLYAAMVLSLSVPFLLLTRQCRYYSPSAFFTLLTLFAYLRLLNDKRGSALLYVLAGTLLFQSFYVYCATTLGAILLHAIIFHRRKIKGVLLWTGVTVLMNVPWILWLFGMTYPARYQRKPTAEFIREFLSQIGEYVFTPYLLLIPAAAAIWYWLLHHQKPRIERQSIQGIALLMLTSAMMVLTLAVASFSPFFRYLAPVIPLGALGIALILDRVPAVVGFATLVILVLWSPLQNLKSGRGRPNDIGTYLYEITHGYTGPVETTVEFLNKYGKSGDVVAVTYEDLPIKYYTDMRVIGGLTGEDLAPAENADWIVFRRHQVSSQEQGIRQLAMRLIHSGRYQPIELPCTDIPFENRESPDQHLSRTATGPPQLVIFRKVAK